MSDASLISWLSPIPWWVLGILLGLVLLFSERSSDSRVQTLLRRIVAALFGLMLVCELWAGPLPPNRVVTYGFIAVCLLRAEWRSDFRRMQDAMLRGLARDFMERDQAIQDLQRDLERETMDREQALESMERETKWALEEERKDREREFKELRRDLERDNATALKQVAEWLQPMQRHLDEHRRMEEELLLDDWPADFHDADAQRSAPPSPPAAPVPASTNGLNDNDRSKPPGA